MPSRFDTHTADAQGPEALIALGRRLAESRGGKFITPEEAANLLPLSRIAASFLESFNLTLANQVGGAGVVLHLMPVTIAFPPPDSDQQGGPGTGA